MTDYEHQNDRIEDLDVTAEEAEHTKGGIISIRKAGGQQDLKIEIDSASSFSWGA
jgi:hypothetical protein